MLRNLFIGAIIACMFVGAAYAETETAPAGVNAYGYTFDDVAVNQGVVLYWYAHGYANCFGAFPETFAAMVEEPTASYGVALMLASRGPGPELDFSCGSDDGDARPLAWPDAAEFVRWLLGDEPRLQLGAGRRRWSWTRAH